MSYSSTWRYPSDAWQWACNTIASRGDLVKTEDGQLTKEVMNLMVTVLEPQTGWPIRGSGWDLPALDIYTKELLTCENKTGFAYTYGQRINAQLKDGDQPIGQLSELIDHLILKPNTRRAIAVTWKVCQDPYENHPPCLIVLDFLYRSDKLHLTAYFRSHDIKQAWPANLYGLSRLLAYVGEQAGMTPGSITTVSASAHIYER